MSEQPKPNVWDVHRRLHAMGSARPVVESEWFRRFPNGGTVNRNVAHQRTEVQAVHWFRRAPNGGGTLYITPRKTSE